MKPSIIKFNNKINIKEFLEETINCNIVLLGETSHGTEEYYKMLQGLGEKTANRNMLRAGIADLAGSPLIGGQAALEAAKNVGALTLGNMGAMAAQNRVLEANPVKTRFAGRYFR